MPRLVRRWEALAWTEFRDLPPDCVAILPVAAIEQHGPHLPLAVDAALNTAIHTAPNLSESVDGHRSFKLEPLFLRLELYQPALLSAYPAR